MEANSRLEKIFIFRFRSNCVANVSRQLLAELSEASGLRDVTWLEFNNSSKENNCD